MFLPANLCEHIHTALQTSGMCHVTFDRPVNVACRHTWWPAGGLLCAPGGLAVVLWDISCPSVLSASHSHMLSLYPWTVVLQIAELCHANLDFLEQETVSGNGICWAICKSAPRLRQITMRTPPLTFCTGWMPFLSPNQQHQSTEGHYLFLGNKHTSDADLLQISKYGSKPELSTGPVRSLTYQVVVDSDVELCSVLTLVAKREAKEEKGEESLQCDSRWWMSGWSL